MKLISIKQLRTDAARCVIKLEDGRSIRTFMTVAADLGLYGGMELDDEKLAELLDAARSMGAKERAARIVGAANVSKKNLIKKLTSKGESEQDAADAAQWLEDLGAVNDRDYAGMIVRSYSARGYGRERIKQKLYEKGVPRSMWDDALGEMPDSSDRIDKYIRAHLPEGGRDRQAVKKVSDTLMRRGYTWNEVSASMSRVLGGEVSEE